MSAERDRLVRAALAQLGERGERRPPDAAATLALVRRLRDRAWRLQRTAEALADAVRDDVGALASDAYARAMRAPDRARAVETALQTLLDLCG